MKNILLTFALTSSLWLNATAFAMEESISKDEISILANIFKNKNYSFKKSLLEYSKSEPVKAKEIETYFSHQTIDSLQFEASNRNLIFSHENQKILLTPFYNGDIQVESNHNSVIVNSSMSIERMHLEISKLFLEGHAGFINLFVSDSYAISPAVALVFAVTALIVAINTTELKNRFSMKVAEEVCESIKNAHGDQIQVGLLKDEYNEITLNSLKCALSMERAKEEWCRKIPEIKKCIKDKIVETEKGKVNNSKTFKRYDIKSDTYKEVKAISK